MTKAPLRPKKTDACPRGHKYVGRNALRKGYTGGVTCRACDAAFQWAKKHSMFNDDSRVVEHADNLYQRYMDEL